MNRRGLGKVNIFGGLLMLWSYTCDPIKTAFVKQGQYFKKYFNNWVTPQMLAMN